jgi:hypothetical protein
MKTLIIKYSQGRFQVKNLYNASEAQIRQILESITPDIQTVLGNYTWNIEKNKCGYQIVAYWEGQHWIESRGKSPRIAVENHQVIRRILQEQYGVEF